MAAPLTYVVLPGLDGTGTLLSELSDALPGSIVITFPIDTVLGYRDLAHYVRQRLPDRDFILVGESFSGPLALSIAADPPSGLKSVVLVASFARLDLPCKPLLSLVSSILSPRVIPMSALSFLLLGRWVTPQRVAALRTAVGMVSASVLSGRARQALAVNLVAQGMTIDSPTLLLEARYDRLVPRNAAATVARVCRNLRVVRIDGPHFHLQAEMKTCAASIRDFRQQILGRQDRHPTPLPT